MATTAVIYRIILLGHIGAAIIGFGGFIAHGAIHAKAVAADAATAAPLLRTAIAISRYAEYGILATLAFGMILVSISDDVFGYSQIWVLISIGIWLAIVGLNHSLVRPGREGLCELAESDSAHSDSAHSDSAHSDSALLQDHAQAKALIAKLAIGEATIQLLMVVVLALMVWKPGL